MNASLKSARVGTTLIIGVFLVTNFKLFAQNERIDSLKEKLSITPKAESFQATLDLAVEYFDIDKNKALEYARSANSIAYSMKDSLCIVKSFRLMGQMQGRLNNLDSSVYYFKKCLLLAKRLRNYQEMHNVLNGIGVVFSFQAKYDEALHHHLLALDLSTGKKDSIRIDRSLFNLGLVYYKLMNYKLALDYYNKSLQIKVAINESYDLDLLKVNIILCYAYLGKIDEARSRLKSLIKSCKLNRNEDLLMSIHFASGVIWYESDSLIMAEKDFLASYWVAEMRGNTRYVFDNIIYLSKIYLRKGDWILSEKFLKEAESMTNVSHFDLEELKLYEEFCTLYAEKKEYKNLSRYREKYIQLKDSIFNERHTNNLMRLHGEASEKENKTRLATQEQQVHLKQEIISKQRGINSLISLAVILLAVLTYLLYRIHEDRKVANIQLIKKITERTLELEHNLKDLALAIKQRDTTLNHISNDLNNSLQFMRIQCSSGATCEINPEGSRYFKEIEATTARLEMSLKNILAESFHSLSSTT